MNCKKIQELLMADYIDGEANEKMRQVIFNHLSACSECRQIKETLKQDVIDPLKAAEKQHPPDFVWENIKSGIIKERQYVPERIGFKILKPAFVVPAVAVVILILVFIGGFPLKGNGKLDSYMVEQVEFIRALDSNGIEADGLGTSIEEYLLL